MPDSKFDKPFENLLQAEMIEKVVDIDGFAFYKITQKRQTRTQTIKRPAKRILSFVSYSLFKIRKISM